MFLGDGASTILKAPRIPLRLPRPTGVTNPAPCSSHSQQTILERQSFPDLKGDEVFDAMALQPSENGAGAVSRAVNTAQTPWRVLDMTGRTVLITGGAEGLGKATALDLARRKARVILTSRGLGKGTSVAEDIVSKTGNPSVFVKTLDLCSFKSVRALVDDIIKTEPRLDVLICNAGAFYDQRTLTEDHVESTFSANYLGHFLLTLQLLPVLKKTPGARIVLLGSMLYLAGSIDFDNLNAEKRFGKIAAYCNSKLAVVMFGRELSRRLQGASVSVYMCDPGVAKTNALVGFVRYMANVFPKCFKSVEEGALTTIYVSTCVDVGNDSGKFYAECKERSVTPQACNVAVARKLWSVSEKLCGTAYE